MIDKANYFFGLLNFWNDNEMQLNATKMIENATYIFGLLNF